MVEQVQEYLEFKRSCGYQLEAPGKELMLFARYAALVGHQGPLTTELVVKWAKLPQDADPCYWAYRYNIVRCFAEYRFLFDPATEVPPKDLLGPSKRHLPPHIYSTGEIEAFLQAASQLAPTNGLHPRTYVTVIQLAHQHRTENLGGPESLSSGCRSSNRDFDHQRDQISQVPSCAGSPLNSARDKALQQIPGFLSFRHKVQDILPL